MIRERIGKYLSMTRRAHAALLDKKLEPYDISHGQIFLLMSLYIREGVCQHSLCQTYNLNKSAVSKGIKKLEAVGFITKEADLDDRRKRLLYLTAKAKEFKPKFMKILDSVESEMKEGLTQDELENYLITTKKMYENLKNKLDN
jgi:DNA-binding MarR family transcriptional regulator